MQLNIIVPVFNEVQSLSQTLENIEKQVKQAHKLIVIDDFSQDNSQEIILRFAKKYVHVIAICNPVHQGFAAVLKQAISLVEEGDILIPVMADGCDDVSIIDQMYEMICAGADIVCGSRYMKGGRRVGGSLLKALGSRIIGGMLCVFKEISCHDMTNSFKMYRAEVLSNISCESQGFEISLEMITKAYVQGYKIIELPTCWTERQYGQTSFKLLRHGWHYLKWIAYGIKTPRQIKI